jgi:hypothetical protein
VAPSSLQITELRFDHAKGHVVGTAKEHETVAAWLSLVEAAPGMVSVTLQKSTLGADGRSAFEVDLEVRYVPHTPRTEPARAQSATLQTLTGFARASGVTLAGFAPKEGGLELQLDGPLPGQIAFLHSVEDDRAEVLSLVLRQTDGVHMTLAIKP